MIVLVEYAHAIVLNTESHHDSSGVNVLRCSRSTTSSKPHHHQKECRFSKSIMGQGSSHGARKGSEKRDPNPRNDTQAARKSKNPNKGKRKNRPSATDDVKSTKPNEPGGPTFGKSLSVVNPLCLRELIIGYSY